MDKPVIVLFQAGQYPAFPHKLEAGIEVFLMDTAPKKIIKAIAAWKEFKFTHKKHPVQDPESIESFDPGRAVQRRNQNRPIPPVQTGINSWDIPGESQGVLLPVPCPYP